MIVFKGNSSSPLLTMVQSGRWTFLRRLQELVVTELAPAHHSREKSQRSLTTHRFTEMFSLRRSLSNRMHNTTMITHGTSHVCNNSPCSVS
uniref:Uncharacterized protein n=1 Tax=Salarias fasciatus TaxID=181472 RepID=A0A672IAA8_SALFA